MNKIRAAVALAFVVALAPPRLLQAQGAGEYPKVSLTAGRSTVWTTEFDVTRIAVTNPRLPTPCCQAARVLIDGKAPGRQPDRAGRRFARAVRPHRRAADQRARAAAASALSRRGHRGQRERRRLVLSGKAPHGIMLRAAEVARATSPKANVLNMLQVPGANDAQQVMLQVRFAEVNRRSLVELGTSFFTGIDGYKNWVGRSTTQQYTRHATSTPTRGWCSATF